MSGTGDHIDNRIVYMKFDNTTFERKLSETVASLDKLHKALEMKGASRGLAEVNSTAKKMDFTTVSQGIEGVSKKFIAMTTLGVLALTKIAGAAATAGAAAIKSFSVNPILDGYREWEMNMNSIQTILANTASKGTTLEQVNQSLDVLNEYSDKTIYNFGQMVQAISKFTAAGVGLKESVSSIKGIANLAAISGSNAEQAASAYTQLSQAIAAGKVRLIDWMSVRNAGMGGEVFKTALFETGKALGTLEGVPMDKTFNEWTKAGNSFEASLEKDWLTTEVLTQTLNAFSGDLSETQLRAIGYTKQQAQEMMKLGRTGIDAATSVKTGTQMLSTIKESIGSGWSASFRIMIGDFKEAKFLFTKLNGFITDAVARSAEHRNKMLLDWKDMGGRNAMLASFVNIFNGLKSVINPIRLAFRDIFPRQTVETLLIMTARFRKFTESLTVSGSTAKKIFRAFHGLFSVFAILKNVVSNTFRTFAQATGPLRSNLLNWAANIGDVFTGVKEHLLDGNRLADFFWELGKAIEAPGKFMSNFTENVKKLFGTLDTSSKKTEGTSGRLERLGGIVKLLGKVWEGFIKLARTALDALSAIIGALTNWVSAFGRALESAIKPGSFNGVIDMINVGLLGGILYLLRKFVKDGLKINLGQGVADKISGMLEELTNSLKALQAKLQADTLKSIAIAIAVLAASLLVLSLIDSAKLLKALTAMSAGMAMLIGAMAYLQKQAIGPKGSLQLIALSTAFQELTLSLVILAVAMKIMSTMSPKELATGLAGIAGALAVLVAAGKLMTANAKGLLLGSTAMIAQAIALTILAKAVSAFGNMDWDVLKQGLGGIAVALAILSAAAWLIPTSLPITASGIVILSGALIILGKAVELFGKLDWDVMKQGLIGVAVTLGILAAATFAMPPTMPLIAAGLFGIGIALMVIVKVVEALGAMDVGVLRQGLIGLGVALTLLAAAVTVMQYSLLGAAALYVVSKALLHIGATVEKLGTMKVGDLVKGLVALAATLLLIGGLTALLSPLALSMASFGAGLVVVGVGLAFIGGGIFLLAHGLSILAESGSEGAKSLMTVFKVAIKALPDLVDAAISAIFDVLKGILKGIPMILKGLGMVIKGILDIIVKNAPQAGRAVRAVLREMIRTMDREMPAMVDAGFKLIVKFLEGLDENMPAIVEHGANALIKFLDGLREKAPELVSSAAALIVSFLDELADHIDEIVTAGANLLIAFILGIGTKIGDIAGAVTTVITELIFQVGENMLAIADAGANMLTALMMGLARDLTGIGRVMALLVGKMTEELGLLAETVMAAGGRLLADILRGMEKEAEKIVATVVFLVLKFVEACSKQSIILAEGAADIIIDFLRELRLVIDEKAPEFRRQGRLLLGAIIDGLTGGLGSRAKDLAQAGVDIAKKVIAGAAGPLGFIINSPSKAFRRIGEYVIEGLKQPFDNDTSVAESMVDLSKRSTKEFKRAMSAIPVALDGVEDFRPTIAPVLDLSAVRSEAKKIGSIMTVPTIAPTVSAAQAAYISTATQDLTLGKQVVEQTIINHNEKSFEQYNTSPKALNTADIYRGTKSQIALASDDTREVA